MGHILKRGNRWYFVVDAGRDENGKRKQKWHSGFRTKGEAKAEMVRVMNEMNNGTYVPPTRLTVAEYLADFLRDYAVHNVSPQTYRRYETIVNKHLIPSLGDVQLSKLQPTQIQRCYTKALEGGRLRGRTALSSTTVLQHHRVLNKALRLAVRKQLIHRNPAEAVEPPRVAHKEMDYYSAEEVQQLLKASAHHRLHIPVLLAVTTGMRRGEILGLKWSDVDLEAGSVTVCRSLQEGKEGFTTKAPKTRSGRRSITLPQTAIVALKRHKAEQAARKLALGPTYDIGEWVCGEEDGSPISPSVLSHGFAAVAKAAGLRKVRFHDLRHTHATLLLQGGENPKVVSERLGHSQVQITLDIYSHVTPNMQARAAERLETILQTYAAASN
jgi:integrase